MVSVLIGFRATVNRHQLERTSPWILLALVGFGLLSALGTLALGVLQSHQLTGVLNELAAVSALWFGGQLAQAALNGGDAALRPELLAALPLPLRRLAWALLAVGLLDPSLAFVALAYAAVIATAAQLSVGAVLIAAGGVVTLTVLTGITATVIGGTLGPGAKRGRDIATIVVAVGISALAVAGTLLPTVLDSLHHGRWSGLTDVVHWLPSGWPSDAVAAAARSDWGVAVSLMLAPLGLALIIAMAWPRLLSRRMTFDGSTRRGPEHVSGRRMLPLTPVGAVTGKEIRLWLRDPIRLTCLLIALIVGIGVGVIPKLVGHSSLLLPFAGPMSVVIAGACACNLYGNDGTSLWLTMLTPGAARADVRGRQLGWLALVAPVALIETVPLTVWADEHAIWPWAIALVIALCGGAAALAPITSLIFVQPPDDAGNPTPGYSLKVHVALIAVTLTAAPAGVLLALGGNGTNPLISWLAVPVAIVTAASGVVVLGSIATRRLDARSLEVLAQLTDVNA